MNAFLKTLSVCLFVLAPGLALGDTLMPYSGNAWTLYVFGNGEVIKNVLMAVAAMVNESAYRNLLSFLATIGVLALAARSGFDPKQAPKLIGYFAGVYLTMYVLLTLDANIEVNDPVSGYSDVVTGVPAAVGVPAAIISVIGHWLTENVEKNFSMANSNLTLTGGGGFNMSTSLVRDAAQVRIMDPYLRQGMSQYMADCVMPMIVTGNMSSADMMETNDLWALVRSENAGILTQYYSKTYREGALLKCPDAYAALTADLAAHAPALIKAAGSAWYANDLKLAGHIQSAYTWLSDNVANGSAAQTVQQAAAIHLMNDSFAQAAAMTGNNEMVMSISLAQAKQTQKSQWLSAAELFKDMVGYIYSILQAFIFAVVPILLVAILIPGFGGVILKNYGQILIWLVLWEPMLAVVNYVIALYAQQGMADTLSNGGLSMGNLTAVTEQTSNFITAAGFMATMVPMISWGLVKGAMAFTEFISSGVGSAFAAGAATGMAAGNVSLDSQSMNNKSFNQENVAHKFTGGMQSIMGSMTGLGSHTHATFNTQTTEAGGALIKPTHSKSKTGAHTRDSSTSAKQSETYRQSLASQESQVLSDMENLGAAWGQAWKESQSAEGSTTTTASEEAKRQHEAAFKNLFSEFSQTKDASTLAAGLSAHLKGAAKMAEIDLSKAGPATAGFLKDYANKAMQYAKDNPALVAGAVAGIALALPALAVGGTAAAVGGLALTALRSVGLGALAKKAGPKLGETIKAAAGGAKDLAVAKAVGELGAGATGSAQTGTTYETGEKTDQIRSSGVTDTTAETLSTQEQEKRVNSLARAVEAMANGMVSEGWRNDTQITKSYAEEKAAERAKLQAEAYKATDQSSTGIDMQDNTPNPHAALNAARGGPDHYSAAVQQYNDHTQAGRVAADRLIANVENQRAAAEDALVEGRANIGTGIEEHQGVAPEPGADPKTPVPMPSTPESGQTPTDLETRVTGGIQKAKNSITDDGEELAKDMKEAAQSAEDKANPFSYATGRGKTIEVEAYGPNNDTPNEE